ncbi:hypothetical protein H310_08581 [Aphanomyces invadans]|uniref:Protein phosphatase methylesterase 1 n=1 Tax=Aphanomyces invadans TaxID=157072 RepID=A0A024TWA9_9STRA|nr:hypothetical protein H310_08581 [Aphanomyces invadans]ETV98415.1 hypothetical protein H310_08581 [Aphanomyces invadans]|eukprot:XP_008872612.1 hypothetical protein H310_08581 [Aphanomyces invadans]
MSLWEPYFDRSEDVDINGDVFKVFYAGSQGPWIVLLHGGGHTALTWCLTTAILKQHCRVLAFDFRGHGLSQCTNDSDLSEATLVSDTINILKRCVPEESSSSPSRTPMILVGHSMGGAIAIRVAATRQLQSLGGMVVIDVVEGTALAALSHMQGILNRRPSRFGSPEEAIKWSLQTGAVRNAESARVSIPSQLHQESTGEWTWRTDLFASAQYWTGWFTGISSLFLNVAVPKVLLLAGTDRLDTELTRGQMQGKFQLLLLYGSGHVIQEDCPDKTAQSLLEFCGRLTPIAGLQTQRDILAEKLARARGFVPQR